MAIALSFGQLSAQKNAWSKIGEESVGQLAKIRPTTYSEKQQLYHVNVDALRQKLENVSDKFAGTQGAVVDFPNVDGGLEKFQVWESSNFAPELQAQYPEIRAYSGRSLTDGSTINFSVSPSGIQTMVLRPDRSSEFIEPYTKDNSVYVLFDSKTRVNGKLPFNCTTTNTVLDQEIIDSGNITGRSSTQSYKTMRLALSCTGEYTSFFGGTVAGALGGMNATMTRVNGIMEIDLAIHLNIIANNNLIIFTNAATDPYSIASVGTDQDNADNLQGWNLQLQNTLTSTVGIGNGAYDIGHLFGASGGGGNAGCIGCVCTDDDVSNNMDQNKGSGYTSPSNNIPQGDTFDVDYVIHEMGHQLGGNHTFSSGVEGSGVNVEPGSGSTIMAYAGIVPGLNVQNNSDPYFTYRSILQIQTNMGPKTCPVSTPIVNTPPVVTAPADFTVPSGTAYILKGVATDAEGDTLSYCWEQNNSANSTTDGAQSVCSPTKLQGPNYRSFNPKSTPDRYMPEYSKVLAGTLSTTWESVSTVSRSYKFTLTVRDNHVPGAQTNTDEVIMTSAAPYNAGTGAGVGPFQLTSQNTTGIGWVPGETETVTWSVNNTTSLPGSANVNIKLSIDGGITFPITLASNVANDGSEDIVVPSELSLNCRLWIEPTANVYYAVNSTPFSIGYIVVTNCTTYEFNTPFALPNGSGSYTVKTISVPTAGVISDVNIHVNATHPNLQNLSLAVIRPGGSLLTYYNQQCSGNANMDVTFDSEAAAFACGSPLTGTMALPTGTLATLNGFSQQGTWQFGFKDSVAGADTGTINSFTLEVCSQSLVPLGTKEFGFTNFALYPNPNNGNFNIQFKSASNSKINILVHDISGRKIFDKAYDNTGLFSQELQLNNAEAGIYLVSITDGQNKVVKRIVVE